MKLDEKDILFLKTYLENADELIASADTYNLLDALDELSVATMDENDEITDIGRKAERLIDKIVYGEQHAQAVCFFRGSTIGEIIQFMLIMTCDHVCKL